MPGKMSSSMRQLVAAIALIGVASATPLQIRDNQTSFSINQVFHQSYLKNPCLETVATIGKYGKSVPQNVLTAARHQVSFLNSLVGNLVSDLLSRGEVSNRAITGSASANSGDYWGSYYLTPVNVAGTTLQINFDTGSSDFWVYSSLQPADQTAGHNYYNVTPSNQMQGQDWNVGYADGSSASGLVYADTVAIGGATVTSQAVEAATSVATSFSSTSQDGILGFAFSSLNTVQPDQQKTWFDNISGQLAKPIFAVTLKNQAAGAYDFGYVDTKKYTGSLTYVNVDSSNGWWQFPVTGYSVGSSQKQYSFIGIADSGTSLIYLDDSVVSAYYAKVRGAQQSDVYAAWVYPCSSTLPSFSITVNGKSQTVPSSLLTYAQVDSQNCYGALQSNSDIGYSIFGDAFFRSQYVVFQTGSTPQIGFAKQAS